MLDRLLRPLRLLQARRHRKLPRRLISQRVMKREAELMSGSSTRGRPGTRTGRNQPEPFEKPCLEPLAAGGGGSVPDRLVLLRLGASRTRWLPLPDRDDPSAQRPMTRLCTPSIQSAHNWLLCTELHRHHGDNEPSRTGINEFKEKNKQKKKPQPETLLICAAPETLGRGPSASMRLPSPPLISRRRGASGESRI